MENVVVVTINYRLHILGLLSLPSKGISGNNGLKDQQMALEWVHENITNFNGDPENICLFDESAGACCVNFQVLNEKSRKLIKNAICQSGSAFSGWAFRGNSTEKDVRQVAKILGCNSESIDDVLETLMKASVKDLYENCEKNPSPSETYHRFRRWRLVIEEESENAFLTQSSIHSIISQKGEIEILMIFGTNDGDGIPRVAANRIKLNYLNQEIEKVIPKSVRANANDSEKFAAKVKKFYFGDRDISNKTLPELVTLFTDLAYVSYQIISNDFMSLYQPNCKIFLNEFQFDGKLNIQKKLVKLENLSGACHSDDVFYLIGGVEVNKVKIEPNSREAKMRKVMCKLWTNFAKFKNQIMTNL
jgi:acetylcholinesterase